MKSVRGAENGLKKNNTKQLDFSMWKNMLHIFHSLLEVLVPFFLQDNPFIYSNMYIAHLSIICVYIYICICIYIIQAYQHV